ncbi:hypothetical protein SAMN05443633_102392 [Chryseobacterium arachidis]|uniref:Uncharacterized protein n=1 Tax=Chryseobacterium arachidis TaxID=1416778 RepID=A0A1M4XQ96_9FLAO|nr:hypothetical protein [Chryseobacterium arachidis]SHE95625.1 hypothetical protein SAMN05443633_102392 [Chryseobacterium arachidis]
MKYYTILLLVFFIACKKQEDIGLPENYILTEKNISDDCNIFQMRFKEGKYLLKCSLAGSCRKMTSEIYIKEYVSYLEKNYDHFAHKKGDIIFDYYGIKDSKILQDSLLKITKRKFNNVVSLSEYDKGSFTLHISYKK